jgi:hypothetical protein
MARVRKPGLRRRQESLQGGERLGLGARGVRDCYVRHGIYASLKAVDARGMRPVRSVAGLEGKSAFVARRVAPPWK